MAGTSTLDPDNLPIGPGSGVSNGRSTGVLGPSDLSDTGSDFSAGRTLEHGLLDSDTDSTGTGEGAGAPGRADGEVPDQDVGFDRVVRDDEAGLGRGLDQAEEAWAGTRDEDAPDFDSQVEAGLAPERESVESAGEGDEVPEALGDLDAAEAATDEADASPSGGNDEDGLSDEDIAPEDRPRKPDSKRDRAG